MVRLLLLGLLGGADALMVLLMNWLMALIV